MALSQIKNGSSVLLNNEARGVDIENLSMQGFQGAYQNADPHWFDASFPVFAFLMVIVVPSVIALWVIYKTLREKDCKEDET